MPSDQCQQYKEKYESLLELKREFDAALAAGNKTRGFGEVMRFKDEIEKVLRNLELDLKFKVWKTIELGTGLRTGDDFTREMEEGYCKISDGAEFIMKSHEFITLSEKTKFELVIVSTADLGFPNGASLEEVYKRAKEIGLELCPPEVGPQLRLQYKDQPVGERLNLAMNTMKDAYRNPCIFSIENYKNGLDLDVRHVSWARVYEFVFVRRKLA